MSSSTTIYATAPTGTLDDTVDITVIAPGGTAPRASADQYTYTVPAGADRHGTEPELGFATYSVIVSGTKLHRRQRSQLRDLTQLDLHCHQ